MYRRSDGIVDFDPSRCIGCKACMQACPYDAIYVDPERGTAAKCHFCAHRVEAGMQPACVVACPEQAIIAGDLDDPAQRDLQADRSRVSQGAQARQADTAQALLRGGGGGGDRPGPGAQRGHVPVRHGQCQDAPAAHAGRARPLARARGAGDRVLRRGALAAMGLAGAGLLLDQVGLDWHPRPPGARHSPLEGLAIPTRLETVLGLIGVVFMALTAGLLVSDLSRPERFIRVLTRPQPRSWVARGAFVLLAYGVACTCFCLSSWAGADGVASAVLWPTVALGLLAAVYTAFLFGQCTGRDLWQTRLLPLHLVVQWVLASSAIRDAPARFARRHATSCATPRCWGWRSGSLRTG